MKLLYVQYGCGLCAPSQWVNFDASPTLKIQRTPIIGKLIQRNLNANFPGNVRYGDIVRGLPVSNDSCDGLYCSHVLEHLSLDDFRKALKNSFSILKKNGLFRCIVPDLEFIARSYLTNLDNGNKLASIHFIEDTLMGVRSRPRGFKAILTAILGNAHHLWMWDAQSLSEELKLAGFTDIRECKFNDCEDSMFKLVEDESRFKNAVAIECRK